MQTLLGGSQSSSTSTPIVGTGTQQQFMQGLFGTGLGQNAQGYGTLQGMPAYPGQLSPEQNANLTGAFGGWSPATQGTDYMSQMLGGGMYTPGQGSMGTAQSNMAQYGGIGGYPTDLMHNMAQFGGTGGPGNYAMSNLMQFGAAGQAGQGLNNMSQFGTSGTWGNPLQATAAGGGMANQPLNSLMSGGYGMGSFSPLQNLAAGTSPFLSNIGGYASGTAGQLGGLQGIVAGQGNPINQLPAWQSMVGAQQRNIAEGATNLAEQFNASDNRFSSAFGQAATDYQNQATANQNAMLGQMVANAGDTAQSRLLGASSTLGQIGAGAAGQYGQLGAGAGTALAGFGAQGAQQYGSQTYGAGNMLAQLGAGATNQLSANSILGAQGLFGAENQAATGMYQGQNQTLGNFLNYNLGQMGLGQSAATGLNSMLMGNLGMGAQLGQQQYNNQQGAINNQYQNWWNSQPQNNPLLQYMYGAATGYTGNQRSSSQGGLLPGLASLGGAAMGAFSDRRLKEDIVKVGSLGPLDLYSYRFKGLPNKQIGFIAQEVYEKFPEAAIPGDDATPWMIKPGVLLEALARSVN